MADVETTAMNPSSPRNVNGLATVLHQLRQRQEEMTMAIQNLTRENIELKNAQTLGDSDMSEQLADLVQVLRTSAEQQGQVHQAQTQAMSAAAQATSTSTPFVPSSMASGTSSLVDVRGIGRPRAFAGDESVFRSWAKKVKAYVLAAVGIQYAPLFSWACDRMDPVTEQQLAMIPDRSGEGYLEHTLELSHQFAMVLSQLTDGERLTSSRIAWETRRREPNHGDGFTSATIPQRVRASECC